MGCRSASYTRGATMLGPGPSSRRAGGHNGESGSGVTKTVYQRSWRALRRLLGLWFWRDELDARGRGARRGLGHLADQLQRFDRRNHTRHRLVPVDAGEHGHLPGWEEELQHAHGLAARMKQDEQFLVFLERLLHGLHLREHGRARIVGPRWGGGRVDRVAYRLFGHLFGEIA